MSSSFKPVSFQSINIGKHIKSSKKRYEWIFELDSNVHTIDLFVSRISGKRTIIVDNAKKVDFRENSSDPEASGNIKISHYMLRIHETSGLNFDLTCGKASFSALLSKQNESNSSQQKSVWENRKDTKENVVPNVEKPNKEAITKPLIVKRASLNPQEQPKPQYPARYSVDAGKPKSVAAEQKPKEIDLLAPPEPDLSKIPDDLFANIEVQPRSYSCSANPFESGNNFDWKGENPSKNVKNAAPVHQPEQGTFDLFDLDSLHLGDGYSPAVAKKIEEANKPICYLPSNIPNMPLNQLQTNRPQPQNPFGAQMINPMMMAYNPYYMNMNQWNQ
ncbi:unnamed protein product [Blepharisma stoltei]|uniref:Uncharacterized protein n=1 Tax=Blepharisma stoltei TaxID=1481888 RepID=A0AAU9JRM4_9CILI|nr:unnamed protein product [Blepharisma stoltei]